MSVETAPRVPFWQAFPDERIAADDFHALTAACETHTICVSLIPGRCGSTLLAGLVAQQACCGTGAEAFNERSVHDWRSVAGTARLFFTKVIRRQQAGGVFWFQATPPRYDHVVSGLDPAVPRTWRHSAILRRDIVNQALSYVYAVRSNVWHFVRHDADHEPGTPVRLPNDPDELADHALLWIERIVSMEERIREIIEAQAAASPLVLWYEDIVRDPRAAVLRFCRAAGVAMPANPPPPRPTVSPLAKHGLPAVRARLWDRHGEAVRCFEQARNTGILAWAAAGTGERGTGTAAEA